MKNIFALIFLFGVLFTGCKKNDEEKENLLLGRWYGKIVTEIEPAGGSTVISNTDGWIEFQENGVFIENDSPTRIKSWTYNATDQYLMVNDIKIFVNKLTKSELYLLYTETNTNTGAKSKFEIQYGR